MCNCTKLAFDGGSAPCGCQGHRSAAFDGSGVNNGTDVLSAEDAMKLVEQQLVCQEETDGLSTVEANMLKVDRYAKMRYYFDTNNLSLTQANILDYKKNTMAVCGKPELLARHPLLKTAGFLVVLLTVTLAALYYSTRQTA